MNEVNENQISETNQLETARTHIEKLMMEVDPKDSDENHRHYFAGVIDTLADLEEISERTREILYAQYCF